MKVLTAIEIHELATSVYQEYWRLVDKPGERRSIPDLYAESFGRLLLSQQDYISRLENRLVKENANLLSEIANES